MDLLNEKWYLSKKKYPKLSNCKNYGTNPHDTSPKRMISTGGRYCFYYRSMQWDKILIKIDLFDVSPQELQAIIKERVTTKNGKIVFGYLRPYEVKWSLNIPDYLKRIVLHYYNQCPN